MTLGQREAGMLKIAGFHPGMVVWHSIQTLSISGREVVGIGGGIVVSLMTGETLGRHIGIVGWIMTLIAIIDRMSQGQREAVCSNSAGFHPGMVVWHSIQTLSIPAERWLGLVVAL